MKEHKRIERLVLFRHVARALNFSRAAEHLGISRGHLSEQIKFLEHELGANLLNRSTRHVSLTVEGIKVLACMDSISNTLTGMERDITHQRNTLEGELKLTAPVLFAHRFLNDICDEFHQMHPDVTFSINTSYESFDLNKKNYDIAFRSTKNLPQDMVAKSLLKYRHCVVAAPKYLLDKGCPSSIAQLASHQCLSGEPHAQWPFKNTTVAVKGWIVLNDNFSVLQQTLNGRGIARFPNYFVAQYVRDKQLIKVLADEPVLTHQIYIIHPPKIQQSTRLKTFLAYVNERINTANIL